MELKSAKKRARSSNWDEEEKKKKTLHTTNTNAKKKAAWQEILSSFNSLNKKLRDMTQIVTQWRNTKGLAKTRESEYRRARQMTGGGPPPPSPPQEDLELIQSLPNESVIDSNVFDSDSIFIETIKQSQSTATEKMMSESGVLKSYVTTSYALDNTLHAICYHHDENQRGSLVKQHCLFTRDFTTASICCVHKCAASVPFDF
ncbi:hypothetical protein SFRURICE_004013, partial [Spodoptera frugiperda]